MRDNGSFVRWQTNTFAQLTFSINLFIGFATASFGFTFSIAKAALPCLDPCGRHRFHLALGSFLVSILLGSVCVLCRLADSRKTTRIARHREQLIEDGLAKIEIDNRLRDRRCTVRWLGKVTWWLFYLQVVSFLMGACAAALAIYRANIV
jgi:hypothetical protein